MIRSDDNGNSQGTSNKDHLPASGAAADGKKIQEMEASVNDLKKHAEATDLNGRATRGEIENMKMELSQINDSIKNLLNVYEAVSRQYNPFVEDDAPSRSMPRVEGGRNAPYTGTPQVNERISAVPLSRTGPDVIDPLGEGPFDSPLDRIVKPDDIEEPEEFLLENGGAEAWKMPGPQAKEAADRGEDLSAYQAPSPKRKISFEEAYALEQIHKLVDHQMSKICKMRMVGEELDAQDIKTLDIWISEFRRLGGC